MTKKKKNSKQENTRESKKAAVLGRGQNKRRLPIIISILSVMILAGGFLAYQGILNSESQTATGNDAATGTASSTEVLYPVSWFDEGKAHHFDFKTGDITVRYFILKSSDGVVRAAFDACDVCWPEGKGYYQEGDAMVCRNCGRRFHSVRINEVKGGCNPAPLNRSIKGDQLVIKIDDILNGKSYFDFSRRG